MRPAFRLLSALVLPCALAASGPAAAGGLLDFLFGGGASAPAPASRAGAPLEFDLRPRGFATPRSRRPRVEARKTPARRDAERRLVKIDPVAEPDWRLRDPTLRAGDIVVLPEGPVVFSGAAGDTHEASDFEPLARSRLPVSLQRQVRMMAAGRWIDAPVSQPPTKTARRPAARGTSPRETWAVAR